LILCVGTSIAQEKATISFFHQWSLKPMHNKFCRGLELRLLLALASLLLLAETNVAHAQPAGQYTLAVLPLEANGRITTEEATDLTNRLASELAHAGVFIVTEQGLVEATLQTAGLLGTGCSTAECGAQAGKLLATQLVVNGSVRKVGQLYFIEAQMIHSSSGQVVQRVTEDFDGDMPRLQNHMATVARKLVGKTTPSSSTGYNAEPAQMSSTEHSGTETSGEAGNTPEMRPRSNKLLVYGLVAVGAAGAAIGITQLLKDSGSEDNNPIDNSTDLPNPPKFP
jgi:TolB-like protein